MKLTFPFSCVVIIESVTSINKVGAYVLILLKKKNEILVSKSIPKFSFKHWSRFNPVPGMR